MIWVVDDNSAVAESLATLLIASGFRAKALTSGRQVMDLLSAGEQPAVMVLDLTMPDSDGNDIIARIIEHPEWTFPVIVSTGYEDNLRDDVAKRVAAILPKTIDPLVMLEHIRGTKAAST